MAEYLTKYPKTVSFLDGLKKVVNIDSSSSVEQLHIVVKKNAQELINIFKQEGFTRVKFEHKQPDQIGNGLSFIMTSSSFHSAFQQAHTIPFVLLDKLRQDFLYILQLVLYQD